MTLAPLLAAPPAVQAHVAFAVAAILLGAVQLARPKRGSEHRLIGRLWMAAMTGVVLSSLLISVNPILGPFGWLHGLSAFTLMMLVAGWVAIRRGRIVSHRVAMVNIYIFALLLTGAFTLLPGRIMHAVLFG